MSFLKDNMAWFYIFISGFSLLNAIDLAIGDWELMSLLIKYTNLYAYKNNNIGYGNFAFRVFTRY